MTNTLRYRIADGPLRTLTFHSREAYRAAVRQLNTARERVTFYADTRRDEPAHGGDGHVDEGRERFGAE